MDLPSDLVGNGKQGEFDMAVWDDDGNLVIVEAKGGNSELGSRRLKYDQQSGGENVKGKRAQQGTKEYLNDIINNYRAKLGDGDDFVNELLDARDGGYIIYASVRQPLNADGSLKGGYIVTEFDVEY